jgi:Cu-Zn family superoxide dismutase
MVALTAALMAGCAAYSPSTAPAATAALVNAAGATVANAVLTGNADGSVSISLSGTGLPAGIHGIHIHAVGACAAPEFTSAGAHFNPMGKLHGLHNPGGPHNGDLPNLTVAASGAVSWQATTDRVTLTPGPTSILDQDGSALVVHAAADDQSTDPSGNSGARIACGVIRVAP